MKLRVGTRGSELALAQTNFVCDLLLSKYDNLEIETKIIKTKGDKILDISLDKIGDKGLFVKEIENQIINSEIDIAVHSLKDMPSDIDPRLIIGKSPIRASEKDIIIVNPKYELDKGEILDWIRSSDSLKVGTGSKRRFYQLLKLNPSLVQSKIRGNIQTRIDKLVKEDLDFIVLAKAGIDRLDIQGLNYIELDMMTMVPAVGQGALAIEMRADDMVTRDMIDSISDIYTTIQVECERAFLKEIGAGCHSPVGAISYIEGEKFCICGLYGDEEGNQLDIIIDSIKWYEDIYDDEEKLESFKKEVRTLGVNLANRFLAKQEN